jgi:hypothetical protein
LFRGDVGELTKQKEGLTKHNRENRHIFRDTSLIGDKAIFSSRRRNSASQARSDATVLFTGTIQDIGKLQGRKYERQDQPDH